MEAVAGHKKSHPENTEWHFNYRNQKQKKIKLNKIR